MLEGSSRRCKDQTRKCSKRIKRQVDKTRQFKVWKEGDKVMWGRSIPTGSSAKGHVQTGGKNEWNALQNITTTL